VENRSGSDRKERRAPESPEVSMFPKTQSKQRFEQEWGAE